MKNYTKENLADFINTLISHGFISLKEGEYPTVILNTQSMKVLKNQEKVIFKEVTKVKKISIDNELFEQLRTLRKDIAAKEGIPPYYVFTDSTLKEMSVRYPLNKEQILDISGVGQVKYEKYGEVFIEAIDEYVVKNNVTVNWVQRTEIKDSQFSTENKKSREPKTTTKKEKTHEITVDMLKCGKGIKEIAKERELTVNTILSHIEKYSLEHNRDNLHANLEELFTEEEEKSVLAAAEKIGIERLAPIKAEIADPISYDAIRAVILKNFVIDKVN